MSRSPDSSTRRTNSEMHRSRTAATRIDAQNIIQPAYINPEGEGLPVSLGQRPMQTTVSRLISHLLQSWSSLSESTVRCDLSTRPPGALGHESELRRWSGCRLRKPALAVTGQPNEKIGFAHQCVAVFAAVDIRLRR